MGLEKKVKEAVKAILRTSFYHLANVDIKKGHRLLIDLGITLEGLAALKPAFEIMFEMKFKKKELMGCYDVEDLVDLVMGKITDRMIEEQLTNPPPVQESQDAMPLLISMAAKMAKADGVVTKEEVDFIEDLMVNTFNMEANRVTIMKCHWTDAKNGSKSFEQYANEFLKMVGSDQDVLKPALRILFHVAAADNKLHSNEERLLVYAANTFGLRDHFEDLKEEYFPGTDKYYAILGCKKGDGKEKVREAYRRLASDSHPDKHSSKGLPHDMMEFAKKRFQEIQEAYEIVMRELG